jgi:hypothetical protein
MFAKTETASFFVLKKGFLPVSVLFSLNALTMIVEME